MVKRKRSNSWWNRTKSTIKGNRYMVMDSDGLPVHTGRDLTKTAALKIAKEARAAGEKVKLVKSNPSRSNNTTFPAHVRINPRTGKTQVFVTPQVANKLRGVKGVRVAGKGKSNPLKQYKVTIPGYGKLGFVASKASDAKRRALDEYSRYTGMKSLPKGTKVTVER